MSCAFRDETDLCNPRAAIFRFPSGTGAVTAVLSDVSALLRHWECGPEHVQDGMIVLAEVLNNVEEHAYAGRAGGPVRIELRVWPGTIHCVVEDRGTPLPAGPLPGENMPASDPVTPEAWPEGGFGWAMVRRLTSELTYERAQSRNRLGFSVSGLTAARTRLDVHSGLPAPSAKETPQSAPIHAANRCDN